MEELGEGFFNEYTTDFYEYFDQHLVKNVVKKGEYKKISDEIKQIKKEYPNLVSLLEEQENVELNKKALRFYYYNLNDRLKSIFQNINTEEK